MKSSVWDKNFKVTVTSSGAERIKTLKEREITLKEDLERWSNGYEGKRKLTLENDRVMHNDGSAGEESKEKEVLPNH